MNSPFGVQILFRSLCLIAVSSASVFSAEGELRGHWRMDDGVGNEVADHSGQENHGTARAIRWRDGVINSGVQLQGGGFIDVGDDESLNIEEAISIDAWLKPWNPRYPQRPTILRKEGSYALHLGPSEEITFLLWLDGKQESVSAELTEWPAGDWRYFAGTFDGETMRVFINGMVAAEKKIDAGRKISVSKNPVYIGSVRTRMPLSGSMDEVRLAARAFSDQEVIETFRKGMFDVSRRNNMFTSFYEKFVKVKPEPLVPGTLWIDAEDFDDYGGWWMDTQFVPQMGSPYLMAAGLHEKVENARTTVDIPEPGSYRLWVRNKNWLAKGHTPGQFKVHIGGNASETTFGTAEQRAWVWQDGGVFDLEGETTIELEDLTGYYGRCDAIILTRDMDFVPHQEQKDYLPMRKRFVEELPTMEMGHFDFVVVGAGVAGCNAAIAAARGGAKVALIQDRPMIGGNNSSELGVPVSGGSSSGKGRETGLNEEGGRIAAYNFNQKWAAGAEVLMAAEPNLTVFLNTHVFKAETDDEKMIKSVTAFNMIDGHLTRYTGDYFADCTGDGWLGYYAGAEWMLGRESKEKFGESLAKDVADNITMSGTLFQHSILGYQAIDMGEPVALEAPEWVYDMRPMAEGYEKRNKYENSYRSPTWWMENHG
ncbi:MAG: FAD-dependent oxidoreductase, partial [Verrucomicrobiota bacterium]